MTTPMKLGVLVSGSGTNLQSILDASLSGRIPVEVAVVISNRPRAKALDRARSAGVPTVVISHRRFKERETFETALIDGLRDHGVQWVALAGFMRLLTPHFLGAFSGRVVNIHPALLPAFPGVHAQRQALDYGVKFTGCTVHFVDQGTDTGAIIGQTVVPVSHDDDEETLAARILEQEHQLYPQMLGLLAQGQVRRQGRKVEILGS